MDEDVSGRERDRHRGKARLLLSQLRRWSGQRRRLNARLAGRCEPAYDWFGDAVDLIEGLQEQVARMEALALQHATELFRLRQSNARLGAEISRLRGHIGGNPP